MSGAIAPPLLAIDAGNTRIKWGLHDGTRWIDRGVLPTAEAGSIAQAWASALVPRRAIVSNVAGEEVRARIEQACSGSGIPVEFIRSSKQQHGVSNAYEEPAQLGTDRWAALVAAHHGSPGHKLVVNAGTALTIDALTVEGAFLGGVIVPGPALMRRALERGTAGLRQTEGEYRGMPNNTADAITSGALQAAAGAIDRMCEKMEECAARPQGIVLSGGAAMDLVPHLSMTFHLREHLVLEGLVIIAGDR